MTTAPESSREPENSSNPYYFANSKIAYDERYVHPSYNEAYNNWIQLYDTAEKGTSRVKYKGITYLPKTEGMAKDVDETRYNTYKTRALYRNFCDTTIKKAKGIMHSIDPYFKLNGSDLKYLLDSASVHGQSLKSLLCNINDQQLLYGRVGMLADFPINGSRQPKIALYNCFSIINWLEEKDENGAMFLRFVMLDESGYVYDYKTNTYIDTKKYRLLGLTESPVYGKVYYSKVFDTMSIGDFNIKEPKDFKTDETIRIFTLGGKTIDYIPFVVANIKNTKMSIESPLLLEQSNHAINCYQNDADYRAAIRLQAFSLLVFTGATRAEIDKHGVQSDGYTVLESPDANAHYEGVNGAGLQEMRMGIDALKQEANDSGIVINDKQGVESGKAIKTRIALKTSDLRDIAIYGAEALQKTLGYIAKWLGVSEMPIVEPNLDFTQETDEPRSLFEMVQCAQAGFMPPEDLYKYGKDNKWYHEPTFKEWDEKRQNGMINLYTGKSNEGTDESADTDI